MEAPQHIVKQLREIDPDADLKWISGESGQGWLLFVRRPNRAAAAQAARSAEEILKGGVTEQTRARYLVHRWMADEGIRPIAIYRGPADDTLVMDFKRRDYDVRNRPDDAAAEAMEVASEDENLTKQKAVLMDAFHSQKKDLFRVLQGTHQVQGGLTKEND